MSEAGWTVERDEDDCLIATAIHAGHDLRPELDGMSAISPEDRLREEDPFTDRWTDVAGNRIVVSTSRFEVDLNRSRESALYLTPDDAWGLTLWNSEVPAPAVERSLAEYDRFYSELGDLCDSMVERHGRFLLLDMHSYNHRRSGPEAVVDDPEENPEINVGTGTVDPALWGAEIAAYIEALSRHPFEGGHLDVRENVRFKGGHMSRWINERYGATGSALAIEMKKIFMDEWTGVPDDLAIASLGEVLAVGAEAVRELVTRD